MPKILEITIHSLSIFLKFYNSAFEEKKYFAYGCQCNFQGDRPMSAKALGPSVDDLDRVCKQYKECLKCASDKYGETCLAESTVYNSSESDGHKVCTDAEGSCSRAICECNKAFAQKHAAENSSWNDKYDTFGTQNWDTDQDCQFQKSAEANTPECCGNPGQAFHRYNSKVKNCCNGIVQKEECSGP